MSPNKSNGKYTKISLLKIAEVCAVLVAFSSALGAEHGEHAESGGVSAAPSAEHGEHGGSGGVSAAPSGGSGGRAYTPTAPRFGGVGAQRYLGVPYHGFPTAGITRYPPSARSGLRNLTTQTKSGQNLGNWSHNDRIGKSRLDRQTEAKLRNWPGKRDNSAQATEEHLEHKSHHHGRDWWRRHCPVIVFIDSGYWGWEDGWWFPAWGYDPYYCYYAYDGPIYGYDGLPSDQIVADVQGALQRLGYYRYAIDGVLGPATQRAIKNYQRHKGLAVTGGIDPETLAALGFTG